MIETFTIATLGGSPTDYARAVDERIKHNKEVVIEERRTFGEVFGKTTETGKTKTFRDFAKDAARALNEAAQERDAAKKRADQQDKVIANLLKRLTAVEKKGKKAAKKGKVKNATKGSAGRVGTKRTSKAKGKSTGSNGAKRSTKRATSKPTTKAKPKAATGKPTVKKQAKKSNNRRK
jgi:hypothetical protein